MFRQDPLNTIMALGSRFTPVALRTAATLRLPSLVHDGHSTVDALAGRTGCDRSALGRVMHYLSLLGVFSETPEKTYELTDVGRVLLDDHPSGLRRWLDFEERSRLVEKRFEPAVDELLEAVRTGQPVYEKVYGRDFWSDLAANPEIDKSFNEGIARTANRIVPELARIYDWASVKHVVDVGGGKGALLARLLGEHPELRGTLLELPNVVEQAKDVLAPVANRCETAPGSFFDPMPAGADVYLIANTLHNWSDDNAERILRRCVEAAGPGNRVVVVERLLDSGKDPVMAAYADLLMLVLLGARERTAEDFREIGGRVGLELTETLRFETPGMWLLEFVVRP